MNCEAYSSFEGVSSDHRIDIAKIYLQEYNMTKTIHHDWSLFSNKNMITLGNKFNAFQEKSKILTPNNEYENFVNDHMEAAAECIPTKLKAKQSSMGDICS